MSIVTKNQTCKIKNKRGHVLNLHFFKFANFMKFHEVILQIERSLQLEHTPDTFGMPLPEDTFLERHVAF